MKLFKLLFTISLCVIATGNFYGQSADPSVISSAGDYVETGNNSVSYTVGQTITATLTNGNTVTQGFQQDDYTIVEIPEESIGDFNVNVFPIPASQEINVEFSDNMSYEATITVYDELGKTISMKKTSNTVNKINISQLADSYYYLKVTYGSSSKTFKILKTD